MGGPLARVRDGALIRVDATAGTLDVQVDTTDLATRPNLELDLTGNGFGFGRELFSGFRSTAGGAEQGAMVVALD